VELRKGEVAQVPEKLARGSRDLKRYRLLRAVEVTYIERTPMSRYPIPTPSRPPRQPQRPARPRQQRPTPAPTPPPPSADVQREVKALKEEVLGLRQLCETMELTLQTIQTALMSRPDAETLAATVGAAVAATMRQMGGGHVQVVSVQQTPETSSSGGRVSIPIEEESEPMFIPSGLVDKDKEVSVQSTEAKDEDASSAAAGLRKFRRNS